MDEQTRKLVEIEARKGGASPGLLRTKPRKWPSKTAAECFECGHVFSDTDWVWRTRVKQGKGFFSGTGWTVAPLCDDCRPDRPDPWSGESWRWDYDAQLCDTCSRPIVNQITRQVRRHIFCSQRCERTYYSERRTRRRRERADLGKACVGCGTAFTASRSDTAYCSNACRQRTYRIRKKMAAAEELEGE